jgi:hypothetical protein
MSTTPVPIRLNDLLTTRFVLNGRPGEAGLRIPRTGDVLTLILEEPNRTRHFADLNLPVEIMRLIGSLNGRPICWKDAKEINDQPEALGAILAARNRLYDLLYEQGRAYFLCPHCGSWEAEFGLSVYALGLNASPWSFFEQGVLMLPPLSATLWPNGSRPADFTTSSRLRFELPTRRVGISSSASGGVLGSLDLDTGLHREAAAWNRWSPEGKERPPERFDWRYANPGFRAMLRLAVALERIDAVDEITPETVGRLPIPDFLFLDVLYYLSHNVDVPPDTRLNIACEECGCRFLPTL